MSDDDKDYSGCLGYGILILIGFQFFIWLIAIMLTSLAISIAVGLFISIFAGLFSVIKNCIVGIKRGVSNMFVKVTLYIVMGLVIFALLAGISWVVANLIIGLFAL